MTGGASGSRAEVLSSFSLMASAEFIRRKTADDAQSNLHSDCGFARSFSVGLPRPEAAKAESTTIRFAL